jgi:hypothetical protein
MFFRNRHCDRSYDPLDCKASDEADTLDMTKLENKSFVVDMYFRELHAHRFLRFCDEHCFSM